MIISRSGIDYHKNSYSYNVLIDFNKMLYAKMNHDGQWVYMVGIAYVGGYEWV